MKSNYWSSILALAFILLIFWIRLTSALFSRHGTAVVKGFQLFPHLRTCSSALSYILCSHIWHPHTNLALDKCSPSLYLPVYCIGTIQIWNTEKELQSITEQKTKAEETWSLICYLYDNTAWLYLCVLPVRRKNKKVKRVNVFLLSLLPLNKWVIG